MTALIVLVSVVVTAILSGVFGLGGGMILMGVLASVLPLASAMILHGLIQLVANGYRAFLLGRHIRWRVSAWVGLGSLGSLALFGVLGVELEANLVFIVLGLLPLLVLALPSSLPLTVASRPQAIACGALSTGLQLVAGASGPILDAFFLRGAEDRFAIIATKAAVSAFGHALKIAYWALILRAGSSGASAWLLAAAIGAALVGTQVGKRILAGLGEDRFRRGSRALIAIVAVAFVVRGLAG